MSQENTPTNKTALITGASDGVGKEVAKRLAHHGFHVILHGRDLAKTQQVREEISTDATGKIDIAIADFAALGNVRNLARQVIDTHPRLDLLINNAGIGVGDGLRQDSADGYELRFAVNYLAHFLLTHLLLATIESSRPARIVNVASAGQAAINFDDVMQEDGYSGVHAYCQSKLAQIMFTIDLAAALRGRGVTVTALHPATYMNTKIVPNPISTVADGAEAIMQLAVGEVSEGLTGVYFDRLTQSTPHPQANDATARQRLWELSLQLVGL